MPARLTLDTTLDGPLARALFTVLPAAIAAELQAREGGEPPREIDLRLGGTDGEGADCAEILIVERGRWLGAEVTPHVPAALWRVLDERLRQRGDRTFDPPPSPSR